MTTINTERSRAWYLLLMAAAIILAILSGLWSGLLLVLEFAFKPLVVQNLWMTATVMAGMGFLMMAYYLAKGDTNRLAAIGNGLCLLLGFHFLGTGLTLFVWQ